MKLAFSTNAYLRFPFAEAVTRLAKIGYAGVEIMADVPHARPLGRVNGLLGKLAVSGPGKLMSGGGDGSRFVSGIRRLMSL